MTERKKPMEPIESFVERQIQEAMGRGAFDRLPGKGKPIAGLDAPRDEMWWLKAFLKREQISLVPAVLELRKEMERAIPAIMHRAREADVRRDVEALNARIRKVNATGAWGPASDLVPLDADDVVARWRRREPGR